jgi:hypothetical protein
MADRALIRELQLIQQSAPDSFRGDFEDTIDSIDRRASVNELEAQIDELSKEAAERSREAEGAEDPSVD